MNESSATAGAYTLAEILSQPQCWSACLSGLEASSEITQVAQEFAGANEWLFVGCGSSYYVALAAATSWSVLTGTRARALPASELLLFPDAVLNPAEHPAAIVISRSGLTSEILKAAEFLKSRDVRTIAVTCVSGPLEQLATTMICLAPADEQSVVMTRSFTSMLLAIQDLAGVISGHGSFRDALRKLPKMSEGLTRSLPKRVREFAETRRFADYICVGQGPFFGVACESALKLTEMSVSYAQCYHTLEFRHGPKSVVGPETLLVFLLSESGYTAECEALEEVKGLGGTTLVIANKADARVRASSDFLIELSLDVPELARLAPCALAGQLLGFYTGLKKRLDPDHPRNLSRVVLLDQERSPEKPEHAAL